MMKRITVEEFAKQVRNSPVDVEPNEYDGVAIQMAIASVSFDDEEGELTFYSRNVSMTIKTDDIDSIEPINEECYFITLSGGMTLTVSKTPEIK